VATVYGDAARPETLEAAGVAEADSLILSAPDLDHKAIIDGARTLNPRVQVLGRATYLSQVPGLLASGADAAYSGEGETALAMMASLMRQLGSTDEQIDRERERVEAEFAGRPAR
jgi:CPA2 family monovalent cation:H+ antiporter-2